MDLYVPHIDFVFNYVFGGHTMRDRKSYPCTFTWDKVKKEMGDIKPLRREWPAYAWPGGYPLYYVTEDSGVLCPKCANEHLQLTLDGDGDAGWKIVAQVINYEDPELHCDHCNVRIESAYAEDKANP